MSDALDRAMQKVRSLPSADQELAAELLEDFAAEPRGEIYQLSAEEEQLIDEGLAELDRGEVASQAEVDAVFARYIR